MVGRLLPLFLTIGLSGQAYASGQSVLDVLMRMQSALHDLNYYGTLIYLQDDTIQTMRVIHESSKNGEHEKLVNLNGAPREVIRDDDIVTCYMPDKKEVTVGKRYHDWNVLSRLVKNDFASMQKFYEFEIESDDRIAGHKSQRILIKPRDNLRYGYRLWIDSANSLLLKSDLLDVDGRAIEQAMFTDINVVDQIPEEMIKPSYNRGGFNRIEQRLTNDSRTDEGKSWRFDYLPDGFSISTHARKRLGEDSQSTDHWIATDGLATVSIYIEKLSGKDVTFEGPSQSGAMNIFGLLIDNYQVTVVGEVPENTAELIARSISKSQMEVGND